MSLAGGIWQPVSIHTFALEFLRAERDTFLAQLRAARPNLISDRELVDLLEKADLANPTHNQARLRLLYLMRSIYIGEIPPDTTWYEVHSLTDDDLPTLYVTRHQTWTDPADNNELLSVSARKNEAAKSPPAHWKRVILWGHDRVGPFAIIEGNHCLVGYVSSKSRGMNIPVPWDCHRRPVIGTP
jgi:hypothetical protein